MDFGVLAKTFRKWEANGSMTPGEGVIVGYHEPTPIPGAIRVADLDGRYLVETFGDDGSWMLLRRYDTEAGATACRLPARRDHLAAGFASGMGPPPLPVMGPP
jgi:hypothetical protein